MRLLKSPAALLEQLSGQASYFSPPLLSRWTSSEQLVDALRRAVGLAAPSLTGCWTSLASFQSLVLLRLCDESVSFGSNDSVTALPRLSKLLLTLDCLKERV